MWPVVTSLLQVGQTLGSRSHDGPVIFAVTGHVRLGESAQNLITELSIMARAATQLNTLLD